MTSADLATAPPRQADARTTRPPVPVRRRGGTAIRLLVLLTAAAILVGFTARWDRWTSAAILQSTDDAYLEADLTALSARVAGHVAAVHVTDFQRVKAGDLLYEIEDRDYRAQLAQATANVAAAEAAVENNASQRLLQQATIEAAVATGRATKADLDRYALDLQRAKALVARGAASVQSLDQAEANDKRTRATLLQNAAQTEAARRQLGVLDTQRKQLLAALAAQRAMRDLAAITLGYTKVRAPTDGMVGQRQVRVGQYVGVGTQLISVVPLPRVWVIANLKETQMTRVRIGDRATVTVDSFPDATLRGRVTGWSPASGSQFSLLPPDNATGNFTKVVQRIPVRIDLEPDREIGDLLRPGMSVVATVETTGGRHRGDR